MILTKTMQIHTTDSTFSTLAKQTVADDRYLTPWIIQCCAFIPFNTDL